MQRAPSGSQHLEILGLVKDPEGWRHLDSPARVEAKTEKQERQRCLELGQTIESGSKETSLVYDDEMHGGNSKSMFNLHSAQNKNPTTCSIQNSVVVRQSQKSRSIQEHLNFAVVQLFLGAAVKRFGHNRKARPSPSSCCFHQKCATPRRSRSTFGINANESWSCLKKKRLPKMEKKTENQQKLQNLVT